MREQLNKLHLPRRLVSGIGSGADGSPCRTASRSIAEHARPISYGYLNGSFPISAYQTIFALCPGSAEMPSAARPFSAELVARLVAGSDLRADHTAHRLVLPRCGRGPAARVVRCQRDDRPSGQLEPGAWRRVIAVGTTATRAIESAAQPDGMVTAASGWTDLVISPERPVRVVDGLITGWHNPEASHLLLVESVAGADPARLRRGRCRALSLARIRRLLPIF